MRRIVVAQGTINGVNRTFTLPGGLEFAAGTVWPILNGITIVPSGDDGCVEIGTTTVEMKIAPRSDNGSTDVLLISYDDGATGSGGTALDVTISGDPSTFQIEWAVETYSEEYSVNLGRIEYNTEEYSILYNTSKFDL